MEIGFYILMGSWIVAGAFFLAALIYASQRSNLCLKLTAFGFVMFAVSGYILQVLDANHFFYIPGDIQLAIIVFLIFAVIFYGSYKISIKKNT